MFGTELTVKKLIKHLLLLLDICEPVDSKVVKEQQLH